MTKYYVYTILNIAISGLFFLFGYGFAIYIIYIGIAFLFVLALCWNQLGEFLITQFVLCAHRVPSDSFIFLEIQRYLDALPEEQFCENDIRIYTTYSKTSYFMPISKKKIIVSHAFEEVLVNNRANSLDKIVFSDVYMFLLSRRVLLLAILGNIIMMRFIELFTMISVIIIRFCCIMGMLIATGAFFEGWGKFKDALYIGNLFGSVFVKINNAFNYAQGKIIDYLMKTTKSYSYYFLEESTKIVNV